jgi:Mn2+/Fe2+ NRAMP family transporter
MGKKLREFFKILGPGVVTGAADDDPSGIATYSQAGAQFGPAVLWLNIFLLPFQAAVQEASARIGAVTGRGIAANVKRLYPRWVLYSVVTLVLFANTINIGADIGAMAESLQLVLPWNFTGWMLVMTGCILILEIFTSYRVYARILKWLALALLVYPLTLVIVAGDAWGALWRATTTLTVPWNPAFLFIAIGVAGTTISPYMFFWQAGQEIEEEKAAHVWRLWGPRIGKVFIGHLRLDNLVGMVMSGVAAWAIMAVASLVLFPHGITDIQTAAQAAQAIEPLVSGFPNAGFMAKLLFTAGIVSLGLLSIPVLSGSAAYAIAEAFNMHEGLNKKFSQAHGFYGAMTISTLFGLLINYLGIDPMKALVYTAVINGVVAVPLIYVIARVADNRKLMGKWRSGWLSKILVYGTAILMGLGALGMIGGIV